MKQNPCRYCALSWENKGRHLPSQFDQHCAECENIKKHKEYLKSKRLFKEGAPITSLDELLKQEWVMWYHQTRHIEVIRHAQLATIMNWLNRGAFHMAVRKESEENK
ncbi:hypothetical protein [Lacrimispora sp.]|uniref:hypothetical protein n=1 Tax=Lacrimispora sp. TaxID=2719234 RepID=UPI003461529A